MAGRKTWGQGDMGRISPPSVAIWLRQFRADHTEPPFRKAHIRPVLDELDESEVEEDQVLDAEEEMATQVRGSYFYKQSVKLDESSFKTWSAEVPHYADLLEEQLEMHVEHIRPERTSADILYEILLKSGFLLTAPLEALALAGKEVQSAAGGALFVCLERALTLELIRAM